ncbi:SulP family inorganic anion transporter [Nocardia sp. NBC_01503]|uniref:SulP family inorganic anion transporter n=1 Tax=Nocardia sp. NBC_01503 TaxID=2975997 RepID=UPI002E7B15BB|nr:SulP family inorganic anion transporter [Nocardia sp. NBC_01503]WTL36047.1 SulP family inorganic anion transporter [Nocardia sp. NBC_01503]
MALAGGLSVATRRRRVRADVVAGLTIWAALVPEAFAFATIAGVPAVTGLYAVIPALLLYALTGGSRHVLMGPMSATAVLSAAVAAPIAAASGHRFLAVTAALALVSGVAGILAGLARLGTAAACVCAPVLVGFITGLVLTGIVIQLPKLFGMTDFQGNFVSRAWSAGVHLGAGEWRTTVLGIGALLVVLIVKRWAPLLPGPLIVVIAGVALVRLFRLDQTGMAVEPPVEPGFPVPDPPAITAHDLVALVGPALAVLLIGFAQGLSAAKADAARTGDEVDVRREMLGFGFANLGAGACSGMVVGASPSRTAAMDLAGARTRLCGAVVAVFTLVTLVRFTGMFEGLPTAVLAAVAIALLIEVLDVAELRRLHRVWRERSHSVYQRTVVGDFGAAALTLLAVLIFGVLAGLLTAVVLSLLLTLRRTAWARLVRRRATRVRDIGPLALGSARIVPVRSGLFFANVESLRQSVFRSCDPHARLVVVDARECPFIDITAAGELGRLSSALAWRGVSLRVATGTDRVVDSARQAWSRGGPLGVYPTVEEALYDNVIR